MHEAMPYQIHWEPRGVYRRYFGDVTIDERRESFDAICSDPRFDALRYTITDYRDAQAYEITTMATAEIAALHVGPQITNPRIVMAAVATRPDIVAAIQEFIELRFTPRPYRIFDSPEAARAWIASLHPEVHFEATNR